MAIFDLAPTLLAAKLGAESVYHRLLAVESNFTAWRHDNPAISHLIDEATTLATDALTAHGVPVGEIEALGTMLPKIVTASLSGLGAADGSVTSGGILATPVPVPAPAPVPEPAAAPAPEQPAPVEAAPAVQ